MEFFNSVPLGYRFIPKDCELIEHYLMKKINCEKLPTNDFQEICINDYHPQDLCTAENRHKRGNNWYFFTQRKGKYKTGSRPDRRVENKKGFWKATGVDAEIKKNNGQIIGYKKTLDFYEEKKEKTQWKMHEYRIDKKMELEKYVLCEIYINTAAKIDDIAEDNINIIDQGDLIPENLDEQNFENINKNLELTSSHTNDRIIIRPQSNNIDDVRDSCNNDNIIDQDDLIPENLDEQNFESIINNLAFDDDHYVHEFKGFDELGVIFQMKNKNTST
ncbi:NAC transcription factor 47-like [Capsicum chacoense]